MVIRSHYLERIRPFISKPLVKVISGVRRCGKSTFLEQIIATLKEAGIKEKAILVINKELVEFGDIRNYKDLNRLVKERFKGLHGMGYLFVDEIQEIENWEKAITSLLAEKKTDIYITGSNARLMSSELATLLAGRYVEIRMHTLTFAEFRSLLTENGRGGLPEDDFELYIRYGGFPALHLFHWDDEPARQYLQAVYNSIVLKDIVVRNSIRDTYMLNKIVEYLIDNCGNITSANRISAFLKSQKRKISVETVQNYIEYACSALLMHKVKRYDIKGRRYLESLEKFYLCDAGFSFATIGYTPDRIPGLLENLVLLELLSRGYEVAVGKIHELEVDFIGTRGQEKIYLQVCTHLKDTAIIEREYRSLETVPDHFTKMVISLDGGFDTSHKGIRWMNIIDFLLAQD